MSHLTRIARPLPMRLQAKQRKHLFDKLYLDVKTHHVHSESWYINASTSAVVAGTTSIFSK